MRPIQFIDVEILIIGSGIAGLRAALEAKKMGAQPLLVSKSPIGKATNTILAGGLFTFATPSFSVDDHYKKTLEVGHMLNDTNLAEQLVERAPAKIQELLDMGLKGYHHKTGFHGRVSDFIGGPHLSAILVRACRDAGVRFSESVMVTDLISDGQVCQGALGFQKNTGNWYGFRSKTVILAAGGAGAIYARTDNAPGATGDGLVLGMKAGLELVDMEFVQFYPLVYAGSGRTHMILPAVFADIGIITNRHGEDIKEKYHLYEYPIAVVSRDRFSQAIFREVSLGNGVDGSLLLDLRKADWTRLPHSSRIQTIFKKKTSFDSQLVKITPACHHTMGGLSVDGNGQTGLKGLFAAGEVMGGLHGANRMGGNALCEALVFGELAAGNALGYVEINGLAPDFESKVRSMLKEKIPNVGNGPTPVVPGDIMKKVKRVLWEMVGIIRAETTLRKGIRELEKILDSLLEQPVSTPQALWRFLESRNAALTGKAIALAALERTESRGAHYRDDFPTENPDWLKHIYIKMVQGKQQISRIEPVSQS